MEQGPSSAPSISLGFILGWFPAGRLWRILDSLQSLDSPAAIPVGFPVSFQTNSTFRSPKIPAWTLLSAFCNWDGEDWGVWSPRKWTTRDLGVGMDSKWEFELDWGVWSPRTWTMSDLGLLMDLKWKFELDWGVWSSRTWTCVTWGGFVWIQSGNLSFRRWWQGPLGCLVIQDMNHEWLGAMNGFKMEIWASENPVLLLPCAWMEPTPPKEEPAPSSSSPWNDFWGWMGNEKLLKAAELSRTPTFRFILMKKLWTQQGKSPGSNYPKWVAQTRAESNPSVLKLLISNCELDLSDLHLGANINERAEAAHGSFSSFISH